MGCIITRKITLIPEVSNRKEWVKRFDIYFKEEEKNKQELLNERLDELESLKKLLQKDPNKYKQRHQEVITSISKLNDSIASYNDFFETGKITRTLLNEYTYSFVKKACKEEARHKNLVIASVASTMISNGYLSLKETAAQDLYKETFNRAVRTKDGLGEHINNPLGGYGKSWSQVLNSKIRDLIFKGALSGNERLPYYKPDSPFTVAKGFMGFEHGYDNLDNLSEHIKDKSAELFFNIGTDGQPTLLRFRLNLGVNPKNKNELTSTIYKVFSGEYKYCGSSVQISGTKIILNLVLDIEKKEMQLDDSKCVGVVFGKEDAVCMVLNSKNNTSYNFGTRYEVETQRKTIAKLRKSVHEAAFRKGGHGRKDRLEKELKFSQRESNYVKTLNHRISRTIIDYAIKNNAKTIKILTGDYEYLLKNWAEYQLMSMLNYKADRVGITIKQIDISELEDVSEEFVDITDYEILAKSVAKS